MAGRLRQLSDAELWKYMRHVGWALIGAGAMLGIVVNFKIRDAFDWWSGVALGTIIAGLAVWLYFSGLAELKRRLGSVTIVAPNETSVPRMRPPVSGKEAVGLLCVLLMAAAVTPEPTEHVWVLKALFHAGATVVAFLWLLADASERGLPEPRNYFPWLLFPEITVPVYVFRTRGWHGGFAWLLRFSAFILAVLVLLSVAEVAAKHVFKNAA